MVTICSETRQLKDTVLNLQAATGITDQTNYGNDGTLNGGMSIVDGAFVFDGTDDYVSVADYKDDQGTDFSYSLFFSLDDHTATGEVLFAQEAYANGVMCQSWAGVIYVYIKSGLEHIQYTIPGYADDVFYHLVLTKKQADSYAKLFINGEEVAATAGASSAGTDPTSPWPLHIGAQVGYGNLTGKIKSFRAFSRAITSTEARELYNATARPDIAGTVLHLRPETGLVDQSGTQDPAAYNGGMGVTGRRYVFDGVDDSILLGKLYNPAAMTLSLWLRGTDVTLNDIIIGDAPGHFRLIQSTSGKVNAILYDTGNRTAPGTSDTLDGLWHHVAVTWDSTTLRIYVDGVQEGSVACGAMLAAGSAYDIEVGGSGTAFKAMDVGEVRLFNVAITAAQVLSLYEGVPGYEPPLPVRQIPDTVLHLEAASGERDLSNHCNYGTFTGTDIAANSTDTEFVFNGTDDYVLMPTTPVVNSTQWTCSFWVKFNSVAAGNESIWGEGTAVTTSLNGAWLYRNGSGLYAQCHTSGASSFKYKASGIFTAGQWHHVVISVDDTAAATSIYIDGVDPGGWSENNNFLTAPTQTTAGPIIGKVSTDTYTYDNELDGEIDDFRIIQRPVTEAEAILLYNKGVRGYRPVGLLGGEVLALHPSRHDVGVLPGTVLQLDGKTGVTDQSPMGNDGTLVGDTFVNSDGYFDLDGVGDKINLGRPLNAAAGTISLRFKTTDSLTSYKRIITDEGGYIAIRANGSTGKLMGYIYDGASKATATSSSVVDDGEWHVATFTWDSTNAVFYLDGSLVGSVAAGAIPSVTSYDLSIGYDGGSGYVDMEVDNFRLLDRALSATEVTTLWNNDISDESGNGNHGTLTNGAYVGEDDEIVFDGTDDYVDTPDNSTSTGGGVLSFNDIEDWTVSVWYKGTDTDQNGDWGKAICGRDNGDLYAQFILRSGYCEYLHYNGGWQHNIKSTTLVADGEWHLLTYVNHSDETGDLYIDGVNEIDGLSSTIDAATRRFVINNFMRGYNGKYTSGSLRDTRVFNRALTAAEVALLASEYEVEVPNTKGSVLSIVPSYDDWGNATLNAMDFSGNGNVGTLTNMTTGDWVADTDSGGTRAIEYDGTNDYVDVGAISLQGEASAATWLKIATTAGGQDHIISDIPQSGLAQFSFEVNRTAGKLSITWGGTVVKTGSTTLSTDQWYHVAVVRSGSTGSWTAELFVDGVSDGSGTTATNPSTQNKDFGIAHSIDPLVSSYMEGTTDDVYLWDRALSLDEIKALASTRNYFDCPVVSSAIIQTRRRRLSLSGGML
jgi:hypothetical protein